MSFSHNELDERDKKKSDKKGMHWEHPRMKKIMGEEIELSEINNANKDPDKDSNPYRPLNNQLRDPAPLNFGYPLKFSFWFSLPNNLSTPAINYSQRNDTKEEKKDAPKVKR